eukprot:865553-Pleurochrysis_carterae.AAC.1
MHLKRWRPPMHALISISADFCRSTDSTRAATEGGSGISVRVGTFAPASFDPCLGSARCVLEASLASIVTPLGRSATVESRAPAVAVSMRSAAPFGCPSLTRFAVSRDGLRS